MIQQSPHWAYTLRKPCSHYFQGTESVPVYISMPLCTLVGFPHGSAGKESTRNEGDLSSIPGLGRSPGEEKGYPLQHSGLENSMDCIVHGVTKSWTRLSDVHFLARKCDCIRYVRCCCCCCYSTVWRRKWMKCVSLTEKCHGCAGRNGRRSRVGWMCCAVGGRGCKDRRVLCDVGLP